MSLLCCTGAFTGLTSMWPVRITSPARGLTSLHLLLWSITLLLQDWVVGAGVYPSSCLGYAELVASLLQDSDVMTACFWALGGHAKETCQLYIENHDLKSNMQPFCFLVSVYQDFTRSDLPEPSSFSFFFPPVPSFLSKCVYVMFLLKVLVLTWDRETAAWSRQCGITRCSLREECFRARQDSKKTGGERWRPGKCCSDKAIKRTSGLMDF